ncbi:Dystroglycan [Bagarius yarrelli]|uniref:Dystroglycan n=1 Tax=Bagarius yarrelli TaxID=175774 RepID=A0A556V9U5_BAGYA|nr:Dystroglycan [Bagarius yarrelli]
MSWAIEPIVMELEASMHSTLLSDIQASVSRVSTVPDSVAVVGQMFRMRIPLVSEDCRAIDLEFLKAKWQDAPPLNLSGIGSAAFPEWLFWDGQQCILQGLPLEGDKGLYRFSLSTEALQSHDRSIHSHLLLSGTKLISSSYTNSRQPDVFFITVYPEDQQDIESVSVQTQSNATNVCICSSGQPATVLTIILDADLTKMNSRERLVLLQKMTHFANEPPELMRVMPVINNHFFDMTAFMAGPGNAKKVVENGALLSWKLGCALDQSKLPNISGVQVPAKDGTMSTILGYPVVGWYIVNKKLQMVKRVRRQIHNTPTPVPSQFAPSTHLVPAERIVPGLVSPYIAPSHNLLVNPARGPLPLPVKPTIRMRDHIAYTPVLIQPLPTQILGSTSAPFSSNIDTPWLCGAYCFSYFSNNSQT